MQHNKTTNSVGEILERALPVDDVPVGASRKPQREVLAFEREAVHLVAHDRVVVRVPLDYRGLERCRHIHPEAGGQKREKKKGDIAV